jgi:hypothetical protein
MRQSEDPRDRIIAEMQERMSALENMISRKAPVAVSESPVTSADLREIERDVVLANLLDKPLRAGEKSVAIEVYRRNVGVDIKRATDFIEAVLRDDWSEAELLHGLQASSLEVAEAFVYLLKRYLMRSGKPISK